MRFGFGGRPPRFPLALAAAALASDVAFPPLRPRLTAAAFLLTAYRQRGLTQGLARLVGRGQQEQGLHAIVGAGVEAVSLQHGRRDTAQHVREFAGLCQREDDGAVGVGWRFRHRQDYTEPLGFCQVGAKRQLDRQKVA
jgi:hypothetical protein